MKEKKLVPLSGYQEYPLDEMKIRAAEFSTDMQRRRTIRQFSDRQVPRKIIEDCLRAAGSAPSGANLQPWQFVVVSDPEIKKEIREAAEKEEKEFYKRRATKEWLKVLAPIGTDERKPFLETAPYLVVIFQKRYNVLPDGRKVKTYYPTESVGIATGILISAVHHAGLASLTHTPSSMGFLNKILDRPAHEKPFLILVVGYPAKDALVPDIKRKSLEEFTAFV
jgi:nitroreductase